MDLSHGHFYKTIEEAETAIKQYSKEHYFFRLIRPGRIKKFGSDYYHCTVKITFFIIFHCGRLATCDGMISLARRRSRVRTQRPARWLFPFFQNSFFQNIILGFRQAKLCLRV